jgi:hypothetical protein
MLDARARPATPDGGRAPRRPAPVLRSCFRAKDGLAKRDPARQVLRWQQKRAGSEIGAPLSANGQPRGAALRGQPQFWPADRLHRVAAWEALFAVYPFYKYGSSTFQLSRQRRV